MEAVEMQEVVDSEEASHQHSTAAHDTLGAHEEEATAQRGEMERARGRAARNKLSASSTTLLHAKWKGRSALKRSSVAPLRSSFSMVSKTPGKTPSFMERLRVSRQHKSALNLSKKTSTTVDGDFWSGLDADEAGGGVALPRSMTMAAQVGANALRKSHPRQLSNSSRTVSAMASGMQVYGTSAILDEDDETIVLSAPGSNAGSASNSLASVSGAGGGGGGGGVGVAGGDVQKGDARGEEEDSDGGGGGEIINKQYGADNSGQSNRVLFYELGLMVIILWNCLEIPFRLAFLESPILAYLVVHSLVDLVLVVDVILRFRIPYRTKTGYYQTDPEQITRKYLRTWFVPDVLSSVPWDLIVLILMVSSAEALAAFWPWRYVRMIRIIRIVHVSNLLRQWEVSLNLDISAVYFRLTRIILLVVLWLHSFACIWWVIARSQEFGADTWVYDVGVVEADIWSQYVTSLYFTVITFTTVGYGDLSPVNTGERALGVFCVLFAVCIMAYVTGNIVSMLNSAEAKKDAIAEKVAFAKKYIRARRVGAGLSARLLRYYRFEEFSKLYDFNDKEVMMQLPPSLRTEMAMHIKCTLLGEWLPELNRPAGNVFSKVHTFVTALVLRLGQESRAPGEYIVNQGSLADKFFILTSGRAAVIKDKAWVGVIDSPSQFGESALFDKRCFRNATVRALTPCDLYTLARDDLEELLRLFPAYQKMFADYAERVQAAFNEEQTSPFDAMMGGSSKRRKKAKRRAKGVNLLNLTGGSIGGGAGGGSGSGGAGAGGDEEEKSLDGSRVLGLLTKRPKRNKEQQQLWVRFPELPVLNNDSALVQIVQEELPRYNKEWGMKTLEDVFTGEELVSFLCKKFGIRRRLAVNVGERLMAHQEIRHANNQKGFEDGPFYYTFVTKTSWLRERLFRMNRSNENNNNNNNQSGSTSGGSSKHRRSATAGDPPPSLHARRNSADSPFGVGVKQYTMDHSPWRIRGNQSVDDAAGEELSVHDLRSSMVEMRVSASRAMDAEQSSTEETVEAEKDSTPSYHIRDMIMRDIEEESRDGAEEGPMAAIPMVSEAQMGLDHPDDVADNDEEEDGVQNSNHADVITDSESSADDATKPITAVLMTGNTGQLV